jgi:cytidyltransferase-like protein
MNQEVVTRVYIDGVFDLFHRGHVEALKKAKNIRKNVYLIVGLISDVDATGYKRQPIYNEDDRYEIISSIKEVDQIVFPAPLVITKGFVELHSIDLVVHGFSDQKDMEKQSEFFRDVSDIFEVIPYFPYVSTSKYIERIKEI